MTTEHPPADMIGAASGTLGENRGNLRETAQAQETGQGKPA